ncbi:MAG: DUF1016 family protein [Eggerthellaceae bacterium]|nr:DUF1016 family protein [Eggerthellaceae bacterium]
MSNNNDDLLAINRDQVVYEGIRNVLTQARSRAAASVNHEMVLAYWEIGRRIHEAVGERGEYGKQLIGFLSERLTKEFGKGFTSANLKNMRQFYRAYRNRYALRSELSWTHYRILMRVDGQDRRAYYETAAANAHWSSRRLEREIHLLCYERSLATNSNVPGKDGTSVSNEGDFDPSAALGVKDPYVLDFLGLPEPTSLHESDLEQALIDHMQEFLLELGSGFAFAGRQMRVSSELSDYYVDLVFYHVKLKCYILIDLKAGKLDPRDVGQMDFYVRLFNDTVALSDDNPTIGIVLCAEGDRAVAKYSALADGRGLFASRYVTSLPSEEELGKAISHFLLG